MKNKILNLKDKILEETIKVLFMTFIYFCYNSNLYTQKDFVTKLRDSSAILIPYAIYIIIISISSFIAKPIKIDVKMRNFTVDGKEETIIHHHEDYSNFRQDTRQIKLTISLKNDSTLWRRMALWLYGKCKFELTISFKPEEEQMLLQPDISNDCIEDHRTSFSIDISNIVKGRLNDKVPCKREYLFMVNENLDNPPNLNSEYYIKAELCLNGKKMNFIQRRFMDVNINLKNGYYLIIFIK